MKAAPPDPPSRRPRGRPDKADAITTAARVVFGRDGFARSSIDAIASTAGVSTRTIYNHYASKEVLFTSVLESSATQVASAFAARVADLRAGVDEGAASGEPVEVDAVLLDLGVALAVQSSDFPEHFAMVRQISAEVGHFPDRVLAAWMDAGPRRVEADVATMLSRLAALGLLVVEDPARAARHFTALVASESHVRPLLLDRTPSAAQRSLAIADAVSAFLHGYGASAGS